MRPQLRHTGVCLLIDTLGLHFVCQAIDDATCPSVRFLLLQDRATDRPVQPTHAGRAHHRREEPFMSVISHASTLCSLPEGSAHFGRAIGWDGPIADHVIDPLFFAGRYRAAFDENWMCCVSTQNIAAAQMKERIHPVVATMGISGSDSDRRMAWADVMPPSVLRGRLLSSLTTSRSGSGAPRAG
ncbi:hypothetical protein RCH11_002563 [Glaciihabitans sp. GrIS 2.15]|nr:hypothetical protein [Glaciihabitans sp. GrIS 2.15]